MPECIVVAPDVPQVCVLPDAFAALAASAAFAVSDIHFNGQISEVRVVKKGEDYLVNPNVSDKEGATLDVIVAANMDNIVMVEGEAKECSEKELVEAIKIGHEAIKVQCQAQLELAQKVGGKALQTREVAPQPSDEDLKKGYCGLGC